VHLRDPTASILFSGDLGRSDDPVMRPPAPAPAADHIVIESTYGNRLHPDEDPADALASVVTATVRRGGIALIPLSGHADADGLLDWLRRAPTAPAGVSVVHGEPAAAETLRRRIHLDLGWDCHVPALTSTITVARRPRAREPVAPGSRRAGGLA
jgi:metallo-beta-lactamase family protein